MAEEGCNPPQFLPVEPREFPRGGHIVYDRDPARQGRAGRAACKNFPSSSCNSAGKTTLPAAPGRPLPTHPAPLPRTPDPAGPGSGSVGAGGGGRAAASRRPARGSLYPRRLAAASGPSPGARAGGSLLPLAAARGESSRAARRERRPLLLLLLAPSSRPASLPLSERSMSERSEDDVGAFSNPVSLGCCCRRNREKATRRKSNGDTGSQSAQSGGVSGQTLVLLDRRRQITLLRQ